MKLQSAVATEIATFVDRHDKEPNMPVRVELEGNVKVLSTYRIPTKLLRFNIRNGRFASELRHKEAELNRSLDNTLPADAKIIQTLLLEQNSTETELLKKDLERHGQIDPGIITHDGAVINANRRLAVITKLLEETRDPKWEYLAAGVLPDTVTEKDLWRIEAGLQFAKDFRLEYGPINELLKLREGIQCGLKPADISATLLGRFSAKDVEERLNVLALIDSYLEMIDKKGDYSIIGQQRSMEKFNSLSANVINQLKTKTDIDPLELHRIAQTAFGLIRSGDHTHWDIRQLAKIARSKPALTALLRTLPADPFEADNEALSDAFGNAVDVVDAEIEHGKPERLLQRALTAVQSIDPTNPKVGSASTQTLLESLIDACAALERSVD